ncbi:MAG: hypothetical protein KDI48_19115 [Xanthomonadales bacterium]|nr:hypothetical protein [Xanthomonadales bacterium]
MLPEALLDRIFQLSPRVRYAAVRVGTQLWVRQREGIANASAAETDRFEELLVNPALLTLVTQRGAIDCGGARCLLVRYGQCFQFVRAWADGHVSVALDPAADVIGLAGQLDGLLEGMAS